MSLPTSAHVELSARMGVESALGHAAVEWVSELRSSTSLDGSVQLQEGRDLRVMLNTPEDVMDIISIRLLTILLRVTVSRNNYLCIIRMIKLKLSLLF